MSNSLVEDSYMKGFFFFLLLLSLCGLFIFPMNLLSLYKNVNKYCKWYNQEVLLDRLNNLMILYVFIYKIKLLTITILAYYKYYGYQINNHLFITSKYILLISSCLLI